MGQGDDDTNRTLKHIGQERDRFILNGVTEYARFEKQPRDHQKDGDTAAAASSPYPSPPPV